MQAGREIRFETIHLGDIDDAPALAFALNFYFPVAFLQGETDTIGMKGGCIAHRLERIF